MCNNFGTIININSGMGIGPCCGRSFSPIGIGGFSPGCFGYGFSPMRGDALMLGMGVGVGCAAGAALVGAMPAIVKGIGQGCSWLWNNAIAPVGKFAWNGICAVGKGIAKGASWLWNNALVPAGKAIGGFFASIGRGIGNFFKKIF